MNDGMRVKDEENICGKGIWEAYGGYVIRSNNRAPQVYDEPSAEYDVDPDAHIIQEWSCRQYFHCLLLSYSHRLVAVLQKLDTELKSIKTSHSDFPGMHCAPVFGEEVLRDVNLCDSRRSWPLGRRL
jgi:hypothetical protein